MQFSYHKTQTLVEKKKKTEGRAKPFGIAFVRVHMCPDKILNTWDDFLYYQLKEVNEGVTWGEVQSKNQISNSNVDFLILRLLCLPKIRAHIGLL